MTMNVPVWPSADEVMARVATLKQNMADAGIDAVLITGEHNFVYFSGFRTLFWLSNARPLMALVERNRDGITILVNRSERRNVEQSAYPGVTPAFYDGFTDAALQAAGDLVAKLPAGSRIGFDYGYDMMGRGSVDVADRLRSAPNNMQLVDAALVIWKQRLIKSEHEILAKKVACDIATSSFFDGLSDLKLDMTEYEWGQRLKQRMIGRGADTVEWLPVRFGKGGDTYARPNSERSLEMDDFVWSDMGARRGDQISDLNRIAKIGKATEAQKDIYRYVRDVTLRLAESVRPGMTGDAVFRVFEDLWSARPAYKLASPGRVGHGSGLALTEPPSLMPGSEEIIAENMILHVEPKLETEGGVFQVEEVFRVTASGPEFLSTLAPAELPVVEL
ncbi:M24 family metallopeptidase [Rhizobium miluonense]|uniref:Xaa-Pro aminopeptidase n=1 Tax=Rhizobium miluonense TaxID=411945 RepID=A0A1C3WZP7_9HYPH|nr:Xaa-Pro peptidase family protein [Rhizobium miluonense]SCB45512.1 Xaa-Pro aminopeptidase [Rhizobium miluonense]